MTTNGVRAFPQYRSSLQCTKAILPEMGSSALKGKGAKDFTRWTGKGVYRYEIRRKSGYFLFSLPFLFSGWFVVSAQKESRQLNRTI